jgi:hypothetical protein
MKSLCLYQWVTLWEFASCDMPHKISQTHTVVSCPSKHESIRYILRELCPLVSIKISLRDHLALYTMILLLMFWDILKTQTQLPFAKKWQTKSDIADFNQPILYIRGHIRKNDTSFLKPFKCLIFLKLISG